MPCNYIGGPGEKMQMHIQKIGMFRPEINPKGQNLDLDVDWAIDYKNPDVDHIEYVCTVKTFQIFPLNFKVEGFLQFEELEKVSKTQISQMIFDRCLEILLKMVNLTKEFYFETEIVKKIPERSKSVEKF